MEKMGWAEGSRACLLHDMVEEFMLRYIMVF